MAAAQINIAHFALGRKSRGKLAMGALVLDTPAPQEALEGLGKFADVSNVMQVEAGSPAECYYLNKSKNNYYFIKKMLPILFSKFIDYF